MVFLKALTVVAACLPLLNATPLQKRSFDYNNDIIRGVNLGGWFVLEPWITPSIFAQWADGGGVVDEYTLSQTLGTTATQSLLQQHWTSWITETDFQQIAAAGLNHVRIPIGYWALVALPEDPYVQGQLEVLGTALEWARTYGLNVLLDLHGAPGSQNGFDNSGRFGPIEWQTGDSVPNTLAAVQVLTKFAQSYTDVVTAIELLNEPGSWALDMDQVKQFYYNGWQDVRNDNEDTIVVIHDAFLDIDSYWNGFMNAATGVNNVMLDTHIYQVFSPGEVARSPCEHVQVACAEKGKIAGTDKWLVVGEWTGAQTDCAKWLNGLGTGARYDGTFPGSSYVGDCAGKYTGTVAGMSQVDKTNLQYYVEAQLDAYEAHTGWIFWNWKTESAPEWNFQDLFNNGLIPNPLTSRNVPSQCDTTACLVPAG